MGTSERREREAQQRRQAILAAAREVFWERGFQGATIPEIARSAELATGTLYLYFPSKEALYLELLIEGYELLLARLTVAAARASVMVDAFFDFAREHPQYFEIIFLVLQKERARWEERFEPAQVERLLAAEAACQRVVAEALQHLAPSRSTSRQATVDAVWAMLAGVVFYFRNKADFPEVARAARNLLLEATSHDER